MSLLVDNVTTSIISYWFSSNQMMMLLTHAENEVWGKAIWRARYWLLLIASQTCSIQMGKVRYGHHLDADLIPNAIVLVKCYAQYSQESNHSIEFRAYPFLFSIYMDSCSLSWYVEPFFSYNLLAHTKINDINQVFLDPPVELWRWIQNPFLFQIK